MRKIDFGKMVSKIKSIKITAVDLTVLIVVLVLSCVVILPSLFQCVDNRNKTKCSEHIYEMLGIMSDELTNETKNEETYWNDLIKNGNYQKLVRVLNDKTGESKKYPSSNYYIKASDEKISIFCKDHKDMPEKSIQLSLLQDVSVEVAEQKQIGEKIVYLSVSGLDTYYEGEALDANNPSKMMFKGTEPDKAIQNLTVTAVYTGGVKEVLPRSRYTLSSKKIDMTKSGQASIVVKSDSRSLWDNSAYARFVVDIIGSNDVAPLIVDGGISGRYKLASWEWNDYVAEADEEDMGKVFGASIITYNGSYYYYPDGFKIINNNKNNSPFEFAIDIEEGENPAYYIEFDVNSIIRNEDDEKDVHNGSIKVENNLIYIWQEEKSRELDEGWIRVYCGLKKY